MEKCTVALMYESHPQAMPLGITENPNIMVIVKRQLIFEATEALEAAERLGDPVLAVSFEASLNRLQKTLDLLIPPELEELYLQDEESGEGVADAD